MSRCGSREGLTDHHGQTQLYNSTTLAKTENRDKGNRPGGLTQRHSYDIMSALCRILRNI